MLGRDFSGTVVHSDDAALPAGTLVLDMAGVIASRPDPIYRPGD